ncbi:MAG: hypothetical protein RLW62_21795 [Gammaproteobacteria bacterium]
MPRSLFPAWLAIAALTGAVYWAGLYGDFAFDDYHVIVDNPTLALASPAPAALLDAAFSTRTGPLLRPLAMLSFAVDRTLGGPQAFHFKLTNLVLHIVNAGLLMVLLRSLLARLAPPSRPLPALAAAVIVALWAVHPINLSSVLYVVQRMTLLAASGVLVALIAYCVARERQLAGRPAAWGPWLAGLGGWVCGLAAKETAALLPLFVLAIECFAFRFVALPRPRPWPRRALLLAALVLVVAAGALLVTFVGNYGGRDFTLGERLMTEARVLFLYLRMLLVPDVSLFALFHDDIALSRGLLAPPTTLPALLGIGAAIALMLRARPRYLAFGIAWFLAAHALESTVLPLELMHEHRNYLAGVGPLVVLVMAACFFLAGRVPARGAALLALAALAILAGVSAVRAAKWADPWQQLAMEAHYHPQSSRTVYEYGRLSIKRAGETGNAALYDAGIAAVERSTTLEPVYAPYVAKASLINQALNTGAHARAERYLADVLADARAAQRAEVFQSIVYCQVTSRCTPAPDTVFRLTDSLLNDDDLRPAQRREVLETLAVYYIRILGDSAAALRILEDVTGQWPRARAPRIRLMEVLMAIGREDEARRMASDFLAAQPWHYRISERPEYRRVRRLLGDAA